MQIQTLRHPYTPIRMATIQNATTPSAGDDIEQQKHSYIAGGNVKWYSHFGKQFGDF